MRWSTPGGTTDGALRTYRASNLAPGPAATALPDAIQVLTPVVPVQPDGRTPSLGSPLETAPVGILRFVEGAIELVGVDDQPR